MGQCCYCIKLLWVCFRACLATPQGMLFSVKYKVHVRRRRATVFLFLFVRGCQCTGDTMHQQHRLVTLPATLDEEVRTRGGETNKNVSPRCLQVAVARVLSSYYYSPSVGQTYIICPGHHYYWCVCLCRSALGHSPPVPETAYLFEREAAPPVKSSPHSLWRFCHPARQTDRQLDPRCRPNSIG